jgi:hypothetical protein
MKWLLATKETAMTTLGKTLFIALSLAVLIAGTLALRSEPEQAARGQLTAAQLAEMQPAAKPADPPKATAAAPDDEPNVPEWDEVEDGSGS